MLRKDNIFRVNVFKIHVQKLLSEIYVLNTILKQNIWLSITI